MHDIAITSPGALESADIAPRAQSPATRPTRVQMVQALVEFVAPDTRKGLTVFVREYLLLIVGMGLALFTVHPALRLVGALLAGLKLNSVYTLGHDAGHSSLTASRRLNRILALLCYTPALFNWRLWHYDHQQIHHTKTQGPQVDVYRPVSLAEYRAFPWWRKAWERLVRSPNPLGFALYITYHSRFEQSKFFPHKSEHPDAVRRAAWPVTVFVLTYLAALLGLMAALSGGNVMAFGANLFFGLILPFFVFMNGIAIGVYLQHTHPEVPWFKDTDDSRLAFDQAALTVNFSVPSWLDKLSHNVMAHQVHHVLPAIPSYRLRAAQDKLAAMLGPDCVSAGPEMLGAIFRQCKLYDFDNRRWLDFDGRPTTRSVALPAAGLDALATP